MKSMTQGDEIKVFEFSDYKEFLRKALPTTGTSRGIRAKLAQALGFHAAFISQVLQGEGHFSIEHILGIAHFLELPQEDTSFLMLLVQKERASNEALKQYFEAEIARALQLRSPMVNREFVSPVDSDLMWTTYFSTWIYAAVHTITSIPAYQTPKAIADHLEISPERIQYYLDFLKQFGLVDFEDGRYKMTKKFVHLEPNSPLVAKHHANWRMRVLQALERGSDNDLHYSAVFSVSSKDAQTIKELLRQNLRDANSIMSESAEEDLYGISLDFFRI